jgi:hypothetical protein
MLHFFNTPQFHKQVSDDMMTACDAINQSLWNLAIDVMKRGMAEHVIRNDINPVEIALILWSNATTLLMRIDYQYDLWKRKMNVDLNDTLTMSNILFLESVLTDRGKKELQAIVN